VAAVVRRRAHSLDGLKANLSVSGGLVLVLVGVNDPANMGALVRVAGALGEAAVLCCTGSADPYGPKAVRASAGALFRVPVLTGIDPEEVLCELGRWGVWRWATVPRGGVPPNEVNLSVPTALVFGNEAHGIPEVLQRYLDGAVTVPIAPDAESLNVAVAAGIICYEAACQRGGLEPQPQRRGRP
jgi:TrmH family RNA methyltransferase